MMKIGIVYDGEKMDVFDTDIDIEDAFGELSERLAEMYGELGFPVKTIKNLSNEV